MMAIVLSAVRAFFSGSAFQMAAALSYYALLSMAPLLLVVTGVAGMWFDEAAVREQLVKQMNQLIGRDGAEVAGVVMNNMAAPERGFLSMTIGIVLTLLGATTVFAQLQSALNRIWQVEPAPGSALADFLKQRFLSLMVLAGVGFLLMISLVLSALLSGLQAYLDTKLPGTIMLWRLLNVVLSLGISTVLLALMFRVMPDARISWRDTWLGAFITAVLFAAGKFAIGLYLGQASVGSAFGAAGSLVVFMVWIYYASLILFLGAEITRVIAESRGPVVAAPHAEKVDETPTTSTSTHDLA